MSEYEGMNRIVDFHKRDRDELSALRAENGRLRRERDALIESALSYRCRGCGADTSTGGRFYGFCWKCWQAGKAGNSASEIAALCQERDALAVALDGQGHSAACMPSKCNCVKGRVGVILSAHDATKDAEIKRLVEALREIESCAGEGHAVARICAEALALRNPCPTCEGTGEIRGHFVNDPERRSLNMPCPDCAGGKEE